MEKVCYSCLFGSYEEIKEPKVITPNWSYKLFTNQPVTSDVWEIIKVDIENKNPQLLAREYKLTKFKEWEQSIYIDASFIIDADLNAWWTKYFTRGLCAPKHPLRNDVYEEGLDCIIAYRGNPDQIRAQIAEYEKIPIPKHNGLISSGILMRENSAEVIELCNRWYEEVRTHSIRDQIAFCKVSMGCDFVHTYNWDYRREKDFLYRKHFANRGNGITKPQ